MKVKKLHNKGNHLLIDIYNCNNLNKKQIKQFLKQIVKKIKMNAISKPYIKNYKAKEKTESGITGFIILAESHISIHTYPIKNFASIDIYSCKKFKYKSLLKYIKKIFNGNIHHKLITRPL